MLTVETHLTTRDDAIQGRNRQTCASPAPRRGRPTHRGRGVLDVEGRAAAFIDGGGRRQAATATAGARRSAGHAAPMHGSRPEREASHPTKEARQEGKVHSSSDWRKTTTVAPAVATAPAKKTQLRNDPGGEPLSTTPERVFEKIIGRRSRLRPRAGGLGHRPGSSGEKRVPETLRGPPAAV